MDQREIDERLKGSTLREDDPYGAHKIMKQIQERELVNHPDYYQGNGSMEVIDIIENYDLGFIEGNILKYLLRYKNKNGLVDLKKCKWYLDKLINNLEKDKK
jgi:hypothetical protein